MDLYDIAVARKLSSGGGGGGTTVEALSVTQNGTYTAPSGKAYSPVAVNVSGGSSDFSAAEVVVTNNLQYDAVPLGVAHVTTYPTEATMPIFTAQPAETSNITVALYKNTALCLILAESAPIQNVSVSGNAEFVPDAGGVIITGDCTITIS